MLKSIVLTLVLFFATVSSGYANGLDYFLGGFVAGFVLDRAAIRYNCCQPPPDRSGYCPDRAYSTGSCQGQRYFRKVWIPGSLQLRCSEGYYNFWGNFVPPDCCRVWVPGFWKYE
jgi:hypothetical protein